MFPQQIHRNIFLFGVCALGFGILLGPFPGSMSMVILGANWLLEGNFLMKWQIIKRHRIFQAFLALFFLSLVGLLHTQDFQWASNILRINLPLIAVPLIVFTSKPISTKEIVLVLYSFILGCFFNTGWCLIHSYVLGTHIEMRDVSRFMSHIRLGLFINLSVAACVYLVYQTKSILKKTALIALAMYFVITLFALGLASALVNLFVLVVIGYGKIIFKQNNAIKIAGLALIAICLALGFNFILKVKNQQLALNEIEYNQLLPYNKNKQSYIHFDTLGKKENGNYIFINIQLESLKQEWNKRVPEDTFSYVPEYNMPRYNALLRYLTSKTLTKDGEGVKLLSDEDVKNIKQGIINYLYPHWSYLHKRIYELVNEYDDYQHNREVNGHSLTMRLYYWQAALQVIKNNFMFGVGTGDVQPELNKLYANDFPELKPDWYKRPHNQFLSITAAYGLLGLIIFLICLIYPSVILQRYLSPLYWVFFTLLCLSFVTEDTLETQAGMAFFINFSALFISEAFFKKQQTPVD